MRTTLDIDPALLEEGARMGGEKSPSKLVNKALEEYVHQLRVARLLRALGTRQLDLDDWHEYRHAERT